MSVIILTDEGVVLTEEEEQELRERLSPLIDAIKNGADSDTINAMLANDEEMSASMNDWEEFSDEELAAHKEHLAIQARGGQRYLH